LPGPPLFDFDLLRMDDSILDVQTLFQTPKEKDQSQILDLDLGNLLVFNFQEQKKAFDIKAQAQLCIQELFDQVFNLPVTASEVGPLVKLPNPTTRIPREKAPPKPKPLTKWETFAKEKGIVKRKRSRMVFDDMSGEHKPRWGKGRALNPETDSWVLPDKPDQLKEAGVADPFELNQMKKK